MKRRNTIATILLNILPCTALLWFFSRNAYLRPYLGSKIVLVGFGTMGVSERPARQRRNPRTGK